jgi:hypothetical protein
MVKKKGVLKMDSREIAKTFHEFRPDLVIGSIMDAGDHLVVYLIDKNMKPGEYMTDNEYLYDKKTKKIKPFRYSDNPELYKRASRHIVYMKPGLRDD